MIGRLSGTLVEKQPNQVIVDVGGVGYRVSIPLSTFTALGGLNEPVILLVHTHLREDQLQLFGFLTPRERQLFEMLITVTGVGPSLALKILSGKPAEELLQAIGTGQVQQLTAISGVGKKTAERIVVELRDRLAEIVAETAAPVPPTQLSGAATQVVAALAGLGYDQREVDAALTAAVGSTGSSDFDQLFRVALDNLTASRRVGRRIAPGERSS